MTIVQSSGFYRVLSSTAGLLVSVEVVIKMDLGHADDARLSSVECWMLERHSFSTILISISALYNRLMILIIIRCKPKANTAESGI